MADGSITIDARINKKGAESDLKALEAKAKSTAKQISSLDKQINSAQTRRSDLGSSLDAARQKANDTADALEKVNEQLAQAKANHLADIKAEYPGLSDSKVQSVLNSRMQGETVLLEQNQKLLADLNKQDSEAAGIESKFQEQESVLSNLQAQHANLVSQLGQENQAVKKQKDLIQHITGDDDMQAYFNKQAAAIESSFSKISDRQEKLYGNTEETATQHIERIVAETKKAVDAQDKAAQAAESRAARERAANATNNDTPRVKSTLPDTRGLSGGIGRLTSGLSGALSGALRRVGVLGQQAFKGIQNAIGGLQAKLTQSTKGIDHMRNRLMRIVSGALVFNAISSGLRKMTDWLGTAALSSSTLRAALGNLQGAAATAAAPLLQSLTPALTAIANAAATAFYYIAKLVSFLTGKSIGASQSAAKAMGKYAKAAKSAGRAADGALAKFDELDVLDKNSGGGAGTITPDYDFTGENPFLDEILQAIEDGDWYGVGRLIGEKLRDSLNAIPWPDIQDKAREWATNIANCINGFIETPGLWEAIGHTLAQGLNTALIFADTLMKGIHWASLGAGLAAGLTTMVDEIDWPLLGNVLTDGMRAAILTLYSFVLTYDGWVDLGNGIASCVNAAIANIPWLEAGLGLSGFAIGLLNTMIAAVEGTDWTALGQDIVTMIGAIDWPGLLSALSTLAIDVLQAINDILDQVSWEDVGQTILDCLQAVDWLGIMSQIGEFINQNWPAILALIGLSLLPQIGTFIIGTVLPSLLGHLATLGVTLLGNIATWLVGTLLPNILGGLATLITSIVSAIGLWPAILIAALVILATAIIAYLVTHWDEIKQKFNETLDNLKEALNQAGEKIKEIWNACWTKVQQIASDLWEEIQQGWSDFWSGIHKALDTAATDIQAGWDDAWNALSDIVSDIWDGITDTIKGAVNGIIGIINGMISAIVGGMNSVIGLLNGFSFDVPEFAQDALGTSKIGFNIDPITAPQIPYLAQGAVIPANHEFLAVLGDQTNGTNVEAPLETIQQALAEVLAAQGGQEITIKFGASGGLEQLVRLLKPYIDKEENRRGARLISGGVY